MEAGGVSKGCSRLIDFHQGDRLILTASCTLASRHAGPCAPPPGTARAVRQLRAGPPFGIWDLPRHGGWRSPSDPATYLPDHPLAARRLEADEPELGLRAATWRDDPYGRAGALIDAHRRAREAMA